MAGTGRGSDFEALRRAGQGVFSLAQAERVGFSRATVRWAAERGLLVRLRHGVYTTALVWENGSERDRHLLVLQAHQRINRAQVGYGLSAAMALNLPLPEPNAKPFLRPRILGERLLEIPVNPPSRVRSRLPKGPQITGGAQTVLDCSRRLGREWGLAVADAAIAQGVAAPAELVTLAGDARGPGTTKAIWVAAHARPLIESPLESLARGVITLAGFPEPLPQQWIGTARGTFRVDMLDQVNRVITEADGKTKYQTAADLWKEKRREDALRDQGFEVVRFTMADFFDLDAWLAEYQRAVERGSRSLREMVVIQP